MLHCVMSQGNFRHQKRCVSWVELRAENWSITAHMLSQSVNVAENTSYDSTGVSPKDSSLQGTTAEPGVPPLSLHSSHVLPLVNFSLKALFRQPKRLHTQMMLLYTHTFAASSRETIRASQEVSGAGFVRTLAWQPWSHSSCPLYSWGQTTSQQQCWWPIVKHTVNLLAL